jgi:protein involved in polysaccharide export with SLBB domain
VAQKLRKYLRDPRVTVAVYSVGPVEALVLGNVKVPGKYTLPPPARLTDAIAAAGGLGPIDGDFPDARLEAPEGTTSTASLQKLLHDGDEAQNVTLESGETVYVPSPASFTVVVSGAVDKPGDVALHEGDDVAMAVARAGASTNAKSDLNHVTVSHTGLDGKTTIQTINLYPILKDGDFSHDIKLQKGDLVFVPQSAPHTNFLDTLNLLRFFVP